MRKDSNIKKSKLFRIVGVNIKNIRLSQNVTLKTLSEKTGIRVNYLRKIEKGEAYGLPTEKFVKILIALNVKPDDIVKDF